jgi:hypothetical protein
MFALENVARIKNVGINSQPDKSIKTEIGKIQLIGTEKNICLSAWEKRQIVNRHKAVNNNIDRLFKAIFNE